MFVDTDENDETEMVQREPLSPNTKDQWTFIAHSASRYAPDKKDKTPYVLISARSLDVYAVNTDSQEQEVFSAQVSREDFAAHLTQARTNQ